MHKIGTLEVELGESKLDGTPLARQGAGDPLAAATNFLAGRGFGDDDRVKVTGNDGMVGTLSVFFITDVEAAPLPFAVAAEEVERRIIKRGAAAKKAAPAGAKRSGAKAGVAKKSGARKSAAKKASGTKSRKGKRPAAKKAAKKRASKPTSKRAK
jgi:hypothetical protein